MSQSIAKIFRDLDKPLLIITLVGFIFGLLTIVTASSRAAVVNYDVSIYYYFFKQLSFIIIGLIIAFFILTTKTEKYRKIVPLLYILLLTLNIVAWQSDVVKGSNNWIDLKFTKIQPSELSKPIIIAMLAIMFEKYYRKLRTKNISHTEIIGKILIIAFAIPAVVFLQKDFGTLLIILLIVFTMLLASPILKIEKLKYAVFLLCLSIAALAVYTITSGEILNDARKSRFSSWFDPCGQYETGGYQVCNSFIAINDGGLTGLGIGKSKQKYSYIPEPHTDSAFAIIAEEYGVIGCTFIFIGYTLIIWRIISISSNASTIRGRYMCLGIATYIFAHILINMGGLFGIMPLTGVPLPFFSYGGSFVISLIAGFAIVQRVNIETKNQKIKINQHQS
ncbi:MAG: FtsW/RodA/SpoVE family cell cycle protein [Bacilli bacterium]|nr:FtsW/RodA/SpoVE family cell cycle protein [Bacilli bacterium]